MISQDWRNVRGWQVRTVILPCSITLQRCPKVLIPQNQEIHRSRMGPIFLVTAVGSTDARQSECIINAELARGVSQDQAYQRWEDGIEEIARAEADHRADDEKFWKRAPQLTGDWPAHWRRGLVYDLETLRVVMRPSVGVFNHPFDGMQIQAPRAVLAEAAMDTLFLSYADPELAAGCGKTAGSAYCYLSIYSCLFTQKRHVTTIALISSGLARIVRV